MSGFVGDTVANSCSVEPSHKTQLNCRRNRSINVSVRQESTFVTLESLSLKTSRSINQTALIQCFADFVLRSDLRYDATILNTLWLFAWQQGC